MGATPSSREVGSDVIRWPAVPPRETVIAFQRSVVVAAPTERPREAPTPRRAATDTVLVRNGEAKSLAVARCYGRLQAREATMTQGSRMYIGSVMVALLLAMMLFEAAEGASG